MAPVHIGLPSADPVDIEVTTFTPSGKKMTRATAVDPKALAGQPLVVRAGANAQTSAQR
jgi:phage terminase large subunit-like protein